MSALLCAADSLAASARWLGSAHIGARVVFLGQPIVCDACSAGHRRRYLLPHGDTLAPLAPRQPQFPGAHGATYFAAAFGLVACVATGDLQMVVDLDHFKTVNYTHGHRYGDRVLLRFTERAGG